MILLGLMLMLVGWMLFQLYGGPTSLAEPIGAMIFIAGGCVATVGILDVLT